VTALQWVGDPVDEHDVTEREFCLMGDGDAIRGILWLPARPEPPGRQLPLVLLGHGGGGHKRADRQLGLARRFAGDWQIAAAAIDSPFHGDRVPVPLTHHVYHQKMAAIGIDTVVDGMVDDWSATLDALGAIDSVDAERVAYLGFSMGTRFGLPFVAAAGRRLRCAVLGKYGMRQPAEWLAGVDVAARFVRDAPRITVPLLFHVQWDDEVFDRTGQFELFDVLGSQDKHLVAFPGSHATAAPAATDAWCEFVARHLGSR
jgi:dienelactone hydrolase